MAVARVKVKECTLCGQGFDEENLPVGNSISSARCAGGNHVGCWKPRFS